MLRRSAFLHWLLTGYLWLIAWIPLGNWNRQREGTLLQALLRGQHLDAGDFGLLGFVTLPAVLFWVAYRRNALWFALSALAVDCVWLAMQIQSWWIPYILGTNGWQLSYAKGPTTKILPSFSRHPAPDAMHVTIFALLIVALVIGISALRELKLLRQTNDSPEPLRAARHPQRN